MNARDKALLEQAKRQNYLLMPYGYNPSLRDHYASWCLSQAIPVILVRFRGKSAWVEIETGALSHWYNDQSNPPGLGPTPELEARLVMLSRKCLESAAPRHKKRATADFVEEQSAYYISQDMAVEAAKELWAIWQEAKQHLVFIPD